MKTEIKDCQFYGVKWDEQALETVQTVADGLLNLTKLFINQNITIESLLKIEDNEATATPPAITTPDPHESLNNTLEEWARKKRESSESVLKIADNEATATPPESSPPESPR